MKILVTGWNGRNKSFIPQAVAMHLKSKGHEVDGWEWDEQWNQDWPTIYGWTWSEDYKRMVHAIPKSQCFDWQPAPLSKYDLVIHLGAVTSTTEKNVEKVMHQNFDFSLWLLNQCQMLKIPLHYASTAGVYGQTTHFQEEGILQPQTPYAYSKYMFDRIVVGNKHRFKTPVIGFRYFNVYGIGESHKVNQASPLYRWDFDISQNKGITLFKGSENYSRDFVWVQDVCEVHEKLLESTYTGILNIGTGEAVSFEHIARKYEEYTACSIYYDDIPEELKCHYQKYTCADTYQLHQLIDHKFTTVDEYLASIYEV